MKQKSIPPFLGIVGDKKWSPFLDLGFEVPFMFTRKWPLWTMNDERNPNDDNYDNDLDDDDDSIER